MQEEALTTGVDDLVHLLQDKGKLALKDAAKTLHVPESTLQLWVDFLVEERVLGVEYKFTKAYIYVNKIEDNMFHKEETIDLAFYKKKFVEKLQAKKIPAAQIESLWAQELKKHLDGLHTYFLQEVKKRKLEKPEILFQAYKRKLMM
jgi:hypothetical protein